MTYVYVVLALVVTLIIHELGHAFQMWKHGIAIKRLGIGIPIGPIGFHVRIGNFPPIYVHPALIGAYVEPENENDIKNLPYTQQDDISAEGVLWNIATAAILMIFFQILNGGVITPLIAIAILVSLFYFRSKLTFIVPLLGVVLVGFTIYIMTGGGAGSGASGDEAGLVGPVGIVQMFGSSSMSFWQMLTIFSLAIGTTNMIPLPPLDGGRIFMTFLERVGVPKEVVNVVGGIGVLTIVVLILFVTVGDIGRILP